MLTNERTERAYFVDWLRVIAVLLLVPHHAAETFSWIGDAYVYAPRRDPSPYFFIQSLFLNVWFMRMLFLISGFSAWHSLRKRTNAQFLRDRAFRTIVPLVFGVCTVCPLAAYLRAVRLEGFEGNVLAFYPYFFRSFASARYLGWGHLWFLAYLFVYSIGFVAFRKIGGRLRKLAACIPIDRAWFPFVVVIAIETLFRPFFPGMQNLYNDWANFLLYGFLFAYGYRLAANDALREKFSKALPTTLAIAIASFALYASLSAAWAAEAIPYGRRLAIALLRGLTECSWVLSLFIVAKKTLNRENAALRLLSESSFALYLFHFAILSYVMVFLLRFSWAVAATYCAAIALTYIIFALVYAIALVRLPPIRFICGIRAKRIGK